MKSKAGMSCERVCSYEREARLIRTTLLGCQGADEFRAMVPAALNFGVTPVEVKEMEEAEEK